MAEAIFAAGCFWGVESKFRQQPGVQTTEVGYTGGHTTNPTYEEVCRKGTGHAEAVRIVYDEAAISYDDLLNVFFEIHDPTQLNRQGPDVGDQYRTAIFYKDAGQKQQADAAIKALADRNAFRQPIVTQIVPAETFYRAEEYHQQYFEKRSGMAPSATVRAYEALHA